MNGGREADDPVDDDNEGANLGEGAHIEGWIYRSHREWYVGWRLT